MTKEEARQFIIDHIRALIAISDNETQESFKDIIEDLEFMRAFTHDPR